MWSLVEGTTLLRHLLFPFYSLHAMLCVYPRIAHRTWGSDEGWACASKTFWTVSLEPSIASFIRKTCLPRHFSSCNLSQIPSDEDYPWCWDKIYSCGHLTAAFSGLKEQNTSSRLRIWRPTSGDRFPSKWIQSQNIAYQRHNYPRHGFIHRW